MQSAKCKNFTVCKRIMLFFSRARPVLRASPIIRPFRCAGATRSYLSPRCLLAHSSAFFTASNGDCSAAFASALKSSRRDAKTTASAVSFPFPDLFLPTIARSLNVKRPVSRAYVLADFAAQVFRQMLLHKIRMIRIVHVCAYAA